MKKLFFNLHLKNIVCFLVIMFSAISVTAGNGQRAQTNLSRHPIKHEAEIDREGSRSSVQRLSCTIGDEDGINISGWYEDIISYEIWDVSVGSCPLLSTYDETEFINYLFSSNGDFIIKFISGEYILIGFISIE